MATPIPIAARIPVTAPTSAHASLPWVACTAASRKTAVSKPSVRTARKAITARAIELPELTAQRVALQLALELEGVPVHPDDHRGHEDHRSHADDRLEHLLLHLRQGGGEHVQADPDAHAERDGEPDADEYRAQRVPVALEEGPHDAHDQGRHEAFAQPDHECAEECSL